MPLVELHVNKEWCKVSDATVRFTVASTYQRSSWDWVAIYKVILSYYSKAQDKILQCVVQRPCVMPFVILHRLDSGITKITRRTYGPKENMQHRWVKYSNSHICFETKDEFKVHFFPFFFGPFPGDIYRGGFTKR